MLIKSIINRVFLDSLQSQYLILHHSFKFLIVNSLIQSYQLCNSLILFKVYFLNYPFVQLILLWYFELHFKFCLTFQRNLTLNVSFQNLCLDPETTKKKWSCFLLNCQTVCQAIRTQGVPSHFEEHSIVGNILIRCKTVT